MLFPLFSLFSLNFSNQKLPVFQAPCKKHNWTLREIVGEELGWGSLPFAPHVELEPVSIQFEQFISWCPRARMEGYGGRYPIIDGSIGTRNALGMLLMSLGLVETIKLFPPQEWIIALKELEQYYSSDRARRQQAMDLVRRLASQLYNDDQVGGVGIIGDLIHPELPWNFWSQISLVLWDVPKNFDFWDAKLELNPEFEIVDIDLPWCTPAQWQQIVTEMDVLIGNWSQTDNLPVRKKMQLFENDS